LSATPASIDRLPPEQGEHSDEILSALGLTADEISELKSAGVVG
jgi:crotonobetainyl-CoA:carnitine CoA-transferase CaiB-like acyl-CoA transferase